MLATPDKSRARNGKGVALRRAVLRRNDQRNHVCPDSERHRKGGAARDERATHRNGSGDIRDRRGEREVGVAIADRQAVAGRSGGKHRTEAAATQRQVAQVCIIGEARDGHGVGLGVAVLGGNDHRDRVGPYIERTEPRGAARADRRAVHSDGCGRIGNGGRDGDFADRRDGGGIAGGAGGEDRTEEGAAAERQAA